MPVIAIILGLVIIVVGSYLLINKDDSGDNTAIVRQEEATKTETLSEHIATSAETTRVEYDTNEPATTSTNIVTEDKPTVTTPVPTKPVIQTTKTYTDEAIYRKSDNTYTIDVTLEVSNGVVKSADVMYGNKETGYEHPLQERFDAVYKTEVVGKKLEDINLSRVGGASLTSKAFNEAVADIIKQANT